VRSYAQVVKDRGFSHLHVNNHVLGANPERRGVMFHSGANIIGSGSKRDLILEIPTSSKILIKDYY
jgi:hypothetical protein